MMSFGNILRVRQTRTKNLEAIGWVSKSHREFVCAGRGNMKFSVFLMISLIKLYLALEADSASRIKSVRCPIVKPLRPLTCMISER